MGLSPLASFRFLRSMARKWPRLRGLQGSVELAGLYPKDDDFAAAKVDEVLDLATDITMKMQPALREPDPEQRKLKREELSREILPRWLGFLENLLEENGNTGFFVRDSLTVADLAAWRLCGWIRGGIIDDIPQTQLDAHPRLLEHQMRIGEIPKIDEWMEKHYAS